MFEARSGKNAEPGQRVLEARTGITFTVAQVSFLNGTRMLRGKNDEGREVFLPAPLFELVVE
jgi:hypothetical protein